MPEGDTIHRWARQLHDALAGRTVRRFELRRDPRGVRPPRAGDVVESVEARGKHLLMRFGNGTTLRTHMRLEGRWVVHAPGERWRRAAHRARVVVELDDGTTAVCFDAPVVELSREGPAAAAPLAALGPDLAAGAADLDAVLARLARVPPDTEVGVALADQRVAAGVGNVFKSEVCWACRVHPRAPLGALDEGVRRGLYETARAQLRANLRTAGRATYAGGLAVYGRAGRPCPRCRSAVRKERDADGRVTFWCPRCQPAPG